MDPKNTEWKIMCVARTACPNVISALNDLKFRSVKETPNSPSSDISAILVIDDEKKIQENTEKLLAKCGKVIQQISITSG